jgi:hypothetical protein
MVKVVWVGSFYYNNVVVNVFVLEPISKIVSPFTFVVFALDIFPYPGKRVIETNANDYFLSGHPCGPSDTNPELWRAWRT